MRLALGASAVLALLPSLALAAPTAETSSPPICLAICYLEKPDCGKTGVRYSELISFAHINLIVLVCIGSRRLLDMLH